MSDEVKRYYAPTEDLQDVADGPPINAEWGSHDRVVIASDYDALAAHLARVEGMLERAMRRINHDVSCSREYDATLRDCPCRLHSLRAEYDKLKAEKAGRE